MCETAHEATHILVLRTALLATAPSGSCGCKALNIWRLDQGDISRCLLCLLLETAHL